MSGFLDDLPDLSDAPRQRPREEPVSNCVTWSRVRCPRCDSARCPVYDSSHVPYRYHKCTRCAWNFQSYETNYRPEPAGPPPR